MRTGLMTALVVLALAAPSVRAQDFAGSADEAQEQAQRDRAEERANREDERYERGTEALDEERWDRAIEAFDSVVNMGGRRADAGLYWKAYAQRKAGRPADALATLG